MLGQKVFIYWNVRKRCWSLRACEGPSKGLVLDHAINFIIKDAVFKVSEAGRQRVLRERKKNVHAGVEGRVYGYLPNAQSLPIGTISVNPVNFEPIRYNPYIYSTFIKDSDQSSIFNVDWVKGNEIGHISGGNIIGQ
jgi:hypothetical protein